jgi:hypothetical protein
VLVKEVVVGNGQITQTEIDDVGRAVPRRRFAATRLLGSRVRIPLRAWMFFSCVCLVGSGLYNEVITRADSYGLFVYI